MQLGDFLLWLAVVATACSAVAYIAAGVGRREWTSLARSAYYAMATATVGISAYLMALILRQRFDVSYVYSYTSKDLEPIYKISAFWAGQEGSFLLWALFGATLGLVLIRKAGKYEPWLMAFWSILQGFFFTLLLIRSPFAHTLTRFPNAALTDGQGLNPLLKNPWMAVHPPLVFLGYAAMAVPAGFVIAALVRRDYGSWARDSLPWALFAWITLGAGIFVGGYWAYEVLGWGGYWGWDPVENASLVPWLTGTALLHGLLVERVRGTLKRTNMVMALLSFLLIVYATFLTRSGVLGDFSVHSFSDLGVNGYLIAFMAFFTLLAVVLYVLRLREIPGGPAFESANSREFAFFLTIIILTVSAVLILFGTSSPIYTKWLGKPQSFAPEFYVRTNAPVAMALVMLMALGPVLAWGGRAKTERRLFWTALGLAMVLVAGIVAAIVMYARGLPDRALPTGAALVVGLGAAVALIVNGERLVRKARPNLRSVGGFVAHVGIALMFVGILLSSSGGKPDKLLLPLGATKASHGYTFTYEGKEPITPTKEALKIRVRGRGVDYLARPMLQPTRDGMMRSPAIRKTVARDLYVAPVEDTGTAQVGLVMGRPVALHGAEYEFLRFVLGGKHTADSLDVGAQIRVKKGGKEAILTPRWIVTGRERKDIPAESPDLGAKISLVQMFVEERGVQIAVVPKTESVVIEVSEKPWISLLWLGAILSLTGGSIAMWRRTCENAKRCLVEELPVLEREGVSVASAGRP